MREEKKDWTFKQGYNQLHLVMVVRVKKVYMQLHVLAFTPDGQWVGQFSDLYDLSGGFWRVSGGCLRGYTRGV